MTNIHHQVLYTGVTSDLVKRIQEHKAGKYQSGFTSKYNVDGLVYFENFSTIEEAIAEEKRIKGGNRLKKIKLIEAKNPDWRDLWEEVSKW